MNTFTISVDSKFCPLLEDILMDDLGCIIEDVYENIKNNLILISTNKTQKDLEIVISEYIGKSDFNFC